MNPSSADPPRPLLEVCGARASAVIVQRVPVEKAERFLELQRGITEAARTFPGYQKVDIYPPAGREREEWVVVIHFDDQQALQRWLDSPMRAEWAARFQKEMGEFRLKRLPAGFNAWFSGLVGDEALPSSWKVALSVLLPLYPTVVLLSLVLPAPDRIGLALSILVSNISSTCVLQWVVSPALNSVLAPWLRANGPNNRRFTLVGLLLILAALSLMLALFRLVVTG
jgi:antibiotic biosynthesis monooxygenase (ABM) superfamily enzyme